MTPLFNSGVAPCQPGPGAGISVAGLCPEFRARAAQRQDRPSVSPAGRFGALQRDSVGRGRRAVPQEVPGGSRPGGAALCTWTLRTWRCPGRCLPHSQEGRCPKGRGARLLRARLTDGAPGEDGAPAQLRARGLESLWASASLPELRCVEVPRVGDVRPAGQTPGPVTPGSAEGRGRQGVGTRGGAGAE